MSLTDGRVFPASLVLVGAGKMGGALLKGWLDLGFPGERIHVLEPAPSPELTALCTEHGVALAVPTGPPEVLVLAIKPQTLDAAVPQLAEMVREETLIISILAGKTMRNVLDRLPSARAIVRAMPNLPAAIAHGVTGAIANSAVTSAQKQKAEALLAAVGAVEWLPEETLIDALTAISGCGPAYVFYLVECLAEAGIAAGLPSAMAARLARAAVEGAGALLAELPYQSPASLRESVTSRGGVTAAALEVLMGAEGFGPLLKKAVLSAKRRAAELSG